jgi:hypothetical protein
MGPQLIPDVLAIFLGPTQPGEPVLARYSLTGVGSWVTRFPVREAP